MKILHLSSELSWRGGEQQIAYLIEELQKQGIQNFVACRQNSAFESHCRKVNIPHLSFSFRGSTDLATAWGIRKLCREKKMKLVHIHSAKSHSLAVLSHLAGNPAPLILSRRVDFPIRANVLTQWKYNHPSIQKIICVSQAIERIVRGSVHHPDRCTTVHSGIDANRFIPPAGILRSKYSLAEDTLLIGNTSALAGHKDYFTFIRTAEIFRSFGISARFFMIGDGPEREKLARHIRGKGLQDYVIMTGFLQNIDEVLPELDIFLMTSEMEGLGTSVLDAFAARVPVVATRAGGIPEMVIHQKTGLLAEVRAVEQLAAHLKLLSKDQALRTSLVEGAYHHLLSNFTKEKMAERTLEVYREVLSGRDA
jgi:glycosyltransferase involved in cell wall biosynthesis